ncbi:MAG TPA: GNAT family N-acetyltransferase [Myxococcota bacterium]|nr:GNAT family N-acetyltransferase [Myxococcota bacterium]HRY95470.1 GNAT family N-acetyltransferase [Myxococcota bacterium]HSA23833.1 GNAT family N-acetyltransferase [Myxococcota bacterium]
MRVREVTWAAEGERLWALREAVFVREQAVPPSLEWDGLDERARHFLAEDDAGDGQSLALGTARLLEDGHVGRVCVLAPARGRGVGGALLRAAVAAARAAGAPRVWLTAQVRAIPFYEAHGFTAEGPEFDDAGIPHRLMVLQR